MAVPTNRPRKSVSRRHRTSVVFFRLKETNDHGIPTFIGDTYDGQTWLDIFEDRSCSEACLCRTFSHCNDTALAFSVSKNPDGMNVYIHSTALSQELNEFGIELQSWTGNRLDGLDLLQKYPILKKSLEGHQRTHRSPGSRKTRTISHLTILVDGFLDNPEIFKSYGFESLLNNDYLDHDLWRKWQSQNSTIDKQLDYLEHAYDTIDNSLQSDLRCEDVQVNQVLFSDDTQHQIPKPSPTAFNRISSFPSYISLGPLWCTTFEPIGSSVSALSRLPLLELGTYQEESHFDSLSHLESPSYFESLRHLESLSRLHSNFGKEHSRIVHGSQSANSPLHKKWADSLHVHHRKSWKAGMRALRKLCNGGTPRRLNEVIPFIALTRSMAETAEIQTGLLSDFDQNLRSWTTIFKDDVVKKTLFADAVEDIWGIDLHGYVMNPTVGEAIPEQVLERLQILANEFVEKANSMFGLDGKTHLTGLSAARLRWQQKYPDGHPPKSCALGEDFAHVEDHFASSLPPFSGNAPLKESRNPARAETCDGSQERIPLLLLTSVAFSCAILFLLMLLVAECSRQFITAYVDNSISDQQNISIQTASENIIQAVVSQCFHLGEYVNLSSIKDTSEVALESFAAYRSFVEGTVSAEHLAIRKTIQDAVLQECDNQQRLIEAETSYGIMKAYLEVLSFFTQEEMPPGPGPSGISPPSEQTYTLEPVQQSPLQMSSPPSSHTNASSLFGLYGNTSVESGWQLDSASARSISQSFIHSPQNVQGFSNTDNRAPSRKRTSSPSDMPGLKKTKPSGEKRWCCEECGKSFKTNCNWRRHFRIAKHQRGRPPCRIAGCEQTFRRVDERNKHEKTEH